MIKKVDKKDIEHLNGDELSDYYDVVSDIEIVVCNYTYNICKQIRGFINEIIDERNKKLLDKAVKRKNELEKAGVEAVVYKEEQFVYDCDSVEFNVYVMLWKDGLVNSSVRIEKIE